MRITRPAHLEDLDDGRLAEAMLVLRRLGRQQTLLFGARSSGKRVRAFEDLRIAGLIKYGVLDNGSYLVWRRTRTGI